jgi:hypothetical protein
MQYVGIEWAYRRAGWCAKQADGTIFGEGLVPADEDGLARLVIELGPEVRACLEMMSEAVWVRDRLAGGGWRVEVADARKVENVAPLSLARPTRSTPACWPSFAVAGSCPRSRSRRSRSAPCASG